MKRVLAVCLLILALAFPSFAGHTTQGNSYCDCTPVNGACPCCGSFGLSRTANQEEEPVAVNADSNSTDSLPEFELLLLGVLVWLRLKA
jgi:hypothetical protein